MQKYMFTEACQEQEGDWEEQCECTKGKSHLTSLVALCGEMAGMVVLGSAANVMHFEKRGWMGPLEIILLSLPVQAKSPQAS